MIIKQCGHVYIPVIFIITFFICLFVFFRIQHCLCKFDEDKNKNLLKKK